MNKLMDNIHNIGIGIASWGFTGAIIFGILVSKLSENPLLYKLYYGLDIEDFQSYLTWDILLTILGIMLFIVGFFRAKTRKSLAATENLANRNYCYNCHVNVSPDTHVCPICSQEIKEK